MNNSTQNFTISLFQITLDITDIIFSAVLPINVILILTLSTLWAIYLIQKILKDYKIERMQSKLRNNYPEHSWLNAMKNFKSNRIKNNLLLAICVTEVVMNAILFYDKFQNSIVINNYDGWFVDIMISSMMPDDITDSLFSYNIFAIYTFSQCVLTFFIRILTQYMVYQYSYYKPYLNIKFEIYISISCYVALILTVVAFTQLKIYHLYLNLMAYS